MEISKITVWRKEHFNKSNPIKLSIYYHFWTEDGRVWRIMADVQKNTRAAYKVEQRWVPVEKEHGPRSTRRSTHKLQKSVPITEKDYHMLVAMIFGEVV